MKQFKYFLILPLTVCLIIACSKKDEEPANTSLSGTVFNEDLSTAINTASIFIENELMATTNAAGEFTIDTIEQGEYQIKCSAIGYRDTSLSINIIENTENISNFSLKTSDEMGRIYGEFHDGNLYLEQLNNKPDMEDWTDQELWEGVSGATIQEKTLQYEIPEIQISIGDSIVAIADAFGQYWFEIQVGTYSLTGTCEGYKPMTQTIEVIANEKTYVNFILEIDTNMP